MRGWIVEHAFSQLHTNITHATFYKKDDHLIFNRDEENLLTI